MATIFTGGTPVVRRAPFEGHKKRVSIFDEQSHYVIENKGSGKRTKPNKANFVGGKPLQAGRTTAVRQAVLALDRRY